MRSLVIGEALSTLVVVVACVGAVILGIHDPTRVDAAFAILTGAIGYAGAKAHTAYASRRSTDPPAGG